MKNDVRKSYANRLKKTIRKDFDYIRGIALDAKTDMNIVVVFYRFECEFVSIAFDKEKNKIVRIDSEYDPIIITEKGAKIQ